MLRAKVSNKYQVVIPKPARDRLKIKEGQELNVYIGDDVILMTPQRKWPDDYIGSQKDIWSKIDVIKYLREERASWD